MPVAINKFPSPNELDRIATLAKYQKLFETDQYGVLGLHEIIKKQYRHEKDIVYLQRGIPSRISEFYGDFVSGDTDDLIIRAGTGVPEQEEFVEETVYENDLKENIFDYAVQQSEYGFTPLIGWLDGDLTFHIDAIPQDQFFPQSDGSVVLISYKEDPTQNFMVQKLAMTQEYTLDPLGNVNISRKAWKCDARGVLIAAYDFAALNALYGGEYLESEVIIGLGELPIRQIDNSIKSKWGFGKSDYADIMPQLAEINERKTQMGTQFLKNLDAKMILPSSMLNEDGKVEAFEAVTLESKDDVKPEYIVNTNTLMSDAREHVLDELQTISFVTAIPMWALNQTSSRPERVESLRIHMFSAMRKTTRKRAKIKRAINDMFIIGFKMRGIEFKEKNIEIKFGDPLPKDALVEAQTESEKITAGISSRQSSIMRLENVDEEEALEELARIKEEDTIAGMGAKPPQLVIPPVLPLLDDQTVE